MGYRSWGMWLALAAVLVCETGGAQGVDSSAIRTRVDKTATNTQEQRERVGAHGNTLFDVRANAPKGSYGSTSAASAQVLLRNIFVDVELHDTLVYCLQGIFCGDSCASVMILNIADPSAPQFVSRYRFHGGADYGYNIRVSGDYLYVTVIAPDSETRFCAIDVSDPLAPRLAGSYLLPAYALGIDVSGSLAYVVNGTSNNPSTLNKVQILNVADPADIDTVGSSPTEYGLDDIRVRNNVAYAVGYYDLYLIDVSDPSQPHSLSTLNTTYLPTAVSLGEADTLVFLADCDTWWPAYWSALTVVDVGDSRQPSILSQFPLFGVVYDVAVQGHWAYVSHGSCGLQVFDITDPATPDSVARYEVPMFAGQLGVDDTILVLADIGATAVDAEGYSCYPPTPGPGDPQEGDLLILSIADPTHPRLLGFYSPTPQDPTPVDDPTPDLLPGNFALYPNYPNPFNPGTVVAFDLPEKSEVRLTVYNLLGQQVKEVTETRPAGHHEMELNLSDEASGVYFYELRAGDHCGTGKMLLLK